MLFSLLMLLSYHSIASKDDIVKAVFIWIGYHVACAVLELDVTSTYTCSLHIGIITFFYTVIRELGSSLRMLQIAKCLKFVHFMILIALTSILVINPALVSEYEYLVYVGLTTLPFCFFDSTAKLTTKITILCSLWTVVAFKIGARAQSTAFLLFAVSWLFFQFLSNHKPKLSKCFFSLYYIFLNIFPLVYTALSVSELRPTLDTLSIKYTHSRFFSGRDVLWNSVYSRMNNIRNITLGLGFSETAKIIEINDMSLHSLYVTLLSQGGILLIAIMGVLLQQIWNSVKANKTQNMRLTLVFLLVILYKQSFDVSLVENNLWVAFPAWFAIAFGLALTHKETKEDEHQKKRDMDGAV